MLSSAARSEVGWQTHNQVSSGLVEAMSELSMESAAFVALDGALLDSFETHEFLT